ncbi:MAG: hypothetical protein RL641_335 [Candidatus Parcubacteria bacterium]
MSHGSSKNDIDTRKRALVYVRVSTDKQADKGIAIPTQTDASIAKIAVLGLECDANFDIYKDEGYSGLGMTKRSGLLSLLNRCKQDKNIKAVVVYELSRLSRNQYDSAFIRNELKKKNISIISTTEQITDDPMGDAMAGMLTVMNEFSSSQTRQRVTDNMMSKAMKGDWPNKAPFGYINKQEKVSTGRVKAWVEINHEDSSWVIKAFKYYASGSYSLDSLLIKLKSEGFPENKLRGTKLTKSFLAGMLRRKFYIGQIEWANYEGPGNHDLFLDKALFFQVQQRLDIQNKGADRRRKYESFTKAICFCGECGSRMTLEKHKTSTGRSILYLRCIKAQQGKKVTCSQSYGHESAYVDQIGEIIKSIQIPPHIVMKVKARVKEIFADEEKLGEATKREIEKHLEKLKTKKKNLINMLLDKEYQTDSDRSLYEETRREIDIEEIRLTTELQKSQGRISETLKLVDLAIALASNIYTAYKGTKDDNLRGLLARTLFKRIEIKDKKIASFELNAPLDYLCRSQFKKASLAIQFEQDTICGPYRTRTCHPLIANEVLYQMS